MKFDIIKTLRNFIMVLGFQQAIKIAPRKIWVQATQEVPSCIDLVPNPNGSNFSRVKATPDSFSKTMFVSVKFSFVEVKPSIYENEESLGRSPL